MHAILFISIYFIPRNAKNGISSPHLRMHLKIFAPFATHRHASLNYCTNKFTNRKCISVSLYILKRSFIINGMGGLAANIILYNSCESPFLRLIFTQHIYSLAPKESKHIDGITIPPSRVFQNCSPFLRGLFNMCCTPSRVVKFCWPPWSAAAVP